MATTRTCLRLQWRWPTGTRSGPAVLIIDVALLRFKLSSVTAGIVEERSSHEPGAAA